LTLPAALRRNPRTSIALTCVVVLALGTGATALTAVASNGHHAPAQHSTGPAAAAAVKTVTTQQPKVPGKTSADAAPAIDGMQRVPRPKHLVAATLLVSSPHAISRHQRHALARLSGVEHSQSIAVGRAKVDHHKATVVGVDPASFRPWTPKLTAKSNPLWASIARGEMTASFDMGHNAKLPLGHTVTVKSGKHALPLRIGAFASVGIANVDAVVAKPEAAALGLHSHTGEILSAPKADPLALRQAALAVLGSHAKAEVLQEVVVTRDAGEFMSRHTISTFLHAAASRVGLPYVWGATGPNSFDCSGLVQWSFAKAGVTMPRVSEDQWLTGPHIPYQDARPGDLLFWHYDPTDPTNIDHVAIYAGNGMMLVAPHTGENVSYEPVPTADMAGVVRVDPATARQIG
jgi:hypothetical protein